MTKSSSEQVKTHNCVHEFLVVIATLSTNHKIRRWCINLRVVKRRLNETKEKIRSPLSNSEKHSWEEQKPYVAVSHFGHCLNWIESVMNILLGRWIQFVWPEMALLTEADPICFHTVVYEKFISCCCLIWIINYSANKTGGKKRHIDVGTSKIFV